MDNILGQIAGVIMLCLMLFFVPVMLISQKQDMVKQNYMDDCVKEFVDNARAAGKITPRAYEALCEKIDIAHMPCELHITHSSIYTVPAAGSHKTETYRFDYNKKEIIDRMYEGDEKDYLMQNGDYLKVEVFNATPTLGTALAKSFNGAVPDVSLYTSYGGFVGNNEQ